MCATGVKRPVSGASRRFDIRQAQGHVLQVNGDNLAQKGVVTLVTQTAQILYGFRIDNHDGGMVGCDS
jgi:hypothetical protein